jgi:hypothetical protein
VATISTWAASELGEEEQTAEREDKGIVMMTGEKRRATNSRQHGAQKAIRGRQNKGYQIHLVSSSVAP